MTDNLVFLRDYQKRDYQNEIIFTPYMNMESPTTVNEEFNALNKQTRSLATILDQQLTTLTKQLLGNDNSTVPPTEVLSSWGEINLKLDQFKAYTEAMEEIMTETEPSQLDPTIMPTLRRYQTRYTQFQKEAQRLESQISSMSARNDLLNNSQSKRRNDRSDLTEQSEAAYFISEQERLTSSHSMIDDTLGQAFELRDELNQQGQTLDSSNSRLLRLTSTIPGINGLLNRISLRRRRDSVILGVVIALGIMFLMLANSS